MFCSLSSPGNYPSIREQSFAIRLDFWRSLIAFILFFNTDLGDGSILLSCFSSHFISELMFVIPKNSFIPSSRLNFNSSSSGGNLISFYFGYFFIRALMSGSFVLGVWNLFSDLFWFNLYFMLILFKFWLNTLGLFLKCFESIVDERLFVCSKELPLSWSYTTFDFFSFDFLSKSLTLRMVPPVFGLVKNVGSTSTVEAGKDWRRRL